MIEIYNIRITKPTELYDVKVCRPSLLGNPFLLQSELERDSVCNRYEIYFKDRLRQGSTENPFKRELEKLLVLYREHGILRLFCWCAPKRCHALTIKEWILNEECCE